MGLDELLSVELDTLVVMTDKETDDTDVKGTQGDESVEVAAWHGNT